MGKNHNFGDKTKKYIYAQILGVNMNISGIKSGCRNSGGKNQKLSQLCLQSIRITKSRNCMEKSVDISTNVPDLTVCARTANAVIKLSAARETHKNDHHHNARPRTFFGKTTRRNDVRFSTKRPFIKDIFIFMTRCLLF